jgi:RNA polymerase sigma factor (sigma-70 family)
VNEQALVEQNLKFAYRIASRYFLPGSEVEDVRQEAAIALIEAARKWNPEVGPFRPFAFKVIRRRLYDCMTAEQCEKRKANHEALQDFQFSKEHDGDWLIDSLPDRYIGPVERLEVREEVARLVRGIGRLSPLERASLLGITNGKSYASIADGLGVTEKSVDNAAMRAKANLRDAA